MPYQLDSVVTVTYLVLVMFRDVMSVFITCNFDEDRINSEDASMETSFSPS